MTIVVLGIGALGNSGISTFSIFFATRIIPLGKKKHTCDRKRWVKWFRKKATYLNGPSTIWPSKYATHAKQIGSMYMGIEEYKVSFER
jgi:hypothetical protein